MKPTLYLGVTILAQFVNALYDHKSEVVVLDATNFESTIKNSDQIALVEFYAPWCGHCKNLAPIYNKVATGLKGLVNVTAVDCDNEKNKNLCGQYGVRGFPTIKVMSAKISKSGSRVVSASDYNGERTVKAIAEHATSVMSSKVQKLSSPELFRNFLEMKNDTTKVLLFTKKGSTASVYKALSIQFGAISFAQVRDSQADAVNEFGITEFPTLIYLPGGSEPSKIYGGKMSLPDLTMFLGPLLDKTRVADEKSTSYDKASVRPSDAENEQIGPAFNRLESIEDLEVKCLDSNSKATLLAEYGLLTKLKFKSRLNDFNYFEYNQEIKDHLTSLGIQCTDICFVNGKRKWFIRPSESPNGLQDVLNFLDDVKQGVAGTKIPFGISEKRDEL